MAFIISIDENDYDKIIDGRYYNLHANSYQNAVRSVDEDIKQSIASGVLDESPVDWEYVDMVENKVIIQNAKNSWKWKH